MGVSLLALALAIGAMPLGATPAVAVSPDVVISQVYGAGGNSGATLTHDYVELFNRGTTSVTMTNWSIQYASATGTGLFGATATMITPFSATIGPGKYLLIQEASQAAVGNPLPPVDVTDLTPILMAAGAGKVALVNSTTPLGCNGSSASLCGPAALAAIVDLVGYGNANFFEGTGASPTLSSTTAAFRMGGGCNDTDNNAADFVVGAPAPRNSATPPAPCDVITDTAPTVVSHNPASGATGVPTNANITIGFSEAVTLSGTWYTIVCTSGTRTATVAPGGPAANVWDLDPTTDFANSEICTVTVLAGNVIDQDSLDPPDNMAANFSFSFTTAGNVCVAPATKIHEIQGSALTSTFTGQVRTVQGVVVGDFQATGQFGGFYLQEEDADVDSLPNTSEGIFIASTTPVSSGDVVRVTGTVTDSAVSGSNLTRLTSVTAVVICPASPLSIVTPTSVTLPVTSFSDFERYEGMLVSFSQTLTVTETFGLGRFGEVRLAAGGRLYNPTAATTPGAASSAYADSNLRRSFVLDDGNNAQNIDPTAQGYYPTGGLSAANTLRSGYTTPGLTGVFDDRFGAYRTQALGAVPFTASNPRTAVPTGTGNLRVASMNVLNYFATIDNGVLTNTTAEPAFDICGPSANMECRGADSASELARQRAKILSALTQLDGDIVGLMEIQNDAGGAVADLVAGLNATMGAGTYAYIDTGFIGTDAIKLALIYKPAAVTPVGDFAIITTATDPRFVDTRNRPSLAQTFRLNSNGAKLTVVVNHLKSKGSGCGAGDDDTSIGGQGNCNGTRTAAAEALADWLASDPTDSDDPDYLIIGDLNSYTFEDPIAALETAGYTNMLRHFHGLDAYSYVFNGESGYLDHALASASLVSQVNAAEDWHINADEPIVLDYNVEFKTAGQVGSFYDPGAYRSSDHDPVLVFLTLAATFGDVTELVEDLVEHDGIANSLVAKLRAAERALDREDNETAGNILEAFINEVEAQRGKKIDDPNATILIDAARGLLD